MPAQWVSNMQRTTAGHAAVSATRIAGRLCSKQRTAARHAGLWTSCMAGRLCRRRDRHPRRRSACSLSNRPWQCIVPHKAACAAVHTVSVTATLAFSDAITPTSSAATLQSWQRALPSKP
eukprot:358364-Chlamydomonas_euryale.AAC.2